MEEQTTAIVESNAKLANEICLWASIFMGFFGCGSSSNAEGWRCNENAAFCYCQDKNTTAMMNQPVCLAEYSCCYEYAAGGGGNACACTRSVTAAQCAPFAAMANGMVVGTCPPSS